MKELKMDAKILHELFEYRDGKLYWKVSRPHTTIKPGDKAGGFGKNGYLMTSINCKSFYNHRIIYMMHYGNLPKFIDHIDGNKANNKIENLREATSSQNNRNMPKKITNTSGIKGVSWDTSSGKWRVRLRINGIDRRIGCFEDIKEAEKAIIQARNLYHGEFANHG